MVEPNTINDIAAQHILLLHLKQTQRITINPRFQPLTSGWSDYNLVRKVLTIFNEGAYLTFKSNFHMALNLYNFDCEITVESVPETNPY